MLTSGVKFDVAQQDHFIVTFGLKLSCKDVFGSLLVASVNFLPRAYNSFGCLFQALPSGVFAKTA